MDPHNGNIYPVNTNKDNEIFGGYVRNPCAQQPQRPQHILPPYGVAMPMGNNMPQQLMYNSHQNQPVYNIMYGPHQSVYRNQNSFTTASLNAFSQPMDWPESCMKSTTFSGKDKYIEKKKENCEENIPSEVYRTKNAYNYNKNSVLDPQWYYGNCESQKYSELPSCSQITLDHSTLNECCVKEQKNIKSVKYCSIQKLPEQDPKLFNYPNKYDNNMYVNQYGKITKEYPSCSQLSQTCNLYSGGSTCLEIDKKILLDHCDVQNVCEVISSSQYYTQNSENALPFIDVPKILEKVPDESNGNGGESDIVVEDSEEEVTDESELEKEEVQPCLVCNITLDTLQFFDIASENTVTSYSQTKVREKLFQFLGWIPNHSKNLCAVCLGLINRLDNLEIQLETVRQELLEKYKSTMKLGITENSENIVIEQNVCKSDKLEKRTHRKKYKLKSTSFKCRVCLKYFSLRKFYSHHMSKHKNKPFICKHCGCNFKNRSILKNHLILQHAKSLPCKLLKEKSTELLKKDFVCHICGKTFKTKTNLKEHENFCSGELPFDCKFCGKKFPSTSKLNQHVKLLHDQNYTKKCEFCGKGFIKNSDFRSHMLTHSSEKNHKCNECGKIYKTLSNLNHHRKIHESKLPHICAVCQKGFLRKENLESHLNIHNGNKPFSCTICEKKFVSRKNLDAHLKVHSGTTTKKTCKICGKQIIHGLDEHMRIHSNHKTFKCIECSMKFLTKGALAKHLKRKHDNKEVDVLKI